jgi:hypothetical protein
MSSSPFNTGARKKKEKELKEADPVELPKFKPLKPQLSKGCGKMLVEKTCSQNELFWIERWLENLARGRGLPPQTYGAEAFSALSQILNPDDFIKILETLRTEFRNAHPSEPTEEEELLFLLDARANDPRCLFKEE